MTQADLLVALLLALLALSVLFGARYSGRG